jgi:hypothetical protein
MYTHTHTLHLRAGQVEGLTVLGDELAIPANRSDSPIEVRLQALQYEGQIHRQGYHAQVSFDDLWIDRRGEGFVPDRTTVWMTV